MKNNLKSHNTHHKTPAGLPLFWSVPLALVAGLAFSLSLAPYYLWPIALFSPMVLYAILKRESSAKRAFWIGQSYGFGLWAVGGFWLYNSIHEYGMVSSAMALAMIGAMAFIMGLFHAVMAWLFVRFMGRQPLAFAGLWVVQEWMKTWFLTGFPWLFVGYAFTEQTWVQGLAPVLGVFGVSFVAVLFASAVVELFYHRAVFAIMAGVALLTSFGLSHVQWGQATGEKLSVSLLQGNIPQDLKWQAQFRDQSLQIYYELSQSEWGRDLVVWPESAIPFFQDDVSQQFLEPVAQEARQAGSTWITGILYRTPQPHHHNSVMIMGADTGVYHKQNLVPFGEYIPFQGLLNLLPGLPTIDNALSMDKGSANQTLPIIKNKAMGVAICYEVAYPDTTRKNAKDTQFLLTVSNDAWFGTTAGPWQHLQMVQMRSIETARWFVRATNNGITAVIDEKGRVVSRLPQFERAVLQDDVAMMTGVTPFVRLGNYPMLVLALLLLVMSFLTKRQNNSTSRTQTYYTGFGVKD